jgi:hypothetical protein
MVSTANKAFCNLFKIDGEEILKAPIYKLNKGWDNEKLKETLNTILEKNDEFDSHHIEAEFSEKDKRSITLSTKRIYLPNNNRKFVLITLLLKNDNK